MSRPALSNRSYQVQRSRIHSAPTGELRKYWDPSAGRYDLNKVDTALAGRIETLAHQILGEPNHALSSEGELRFGNKGSLCVTTEGDYRGGWYDFERGEGGRPLKLIQHATGCDFKSALKKGLDFIVDLPISTSSSDSDRSEQGPGASDRRNVGHISKELRRNRTRDYGLRIFKESRQLGGTLGERYLREYRGIRRGLQLVNLRFHPSVQSRKDLKTPALIAVARNSEGEVSCIQATYLDPKTASKFPNLEIPKRTYGNLKGSIVTLFDTNRRDKVTYAAEGVETGLSIAQVVHGQHIVVTLGKHNMKYLHNHNPGDTVVLCVDNDGDATFQDASIAHTVIELISLGKKVFIAMPPVPKTDFNDVLIEKSMAHSETNRGKRGKELLIQYLNNRRDWQQIPILVQEVAKIKASKISREKD
eukprot:CAMPEP_0167755690 /NCGR_PEP_ID=MMETSP0110_2-20121227/8968_1 /TAXON_ID=629695 /ORGANISM="Gymnochlora sp., Strain CCMP2014" /LENGTH=418 /DNA_ID=CAMNT_0007641713 /DNA_START=314 /DNA_END=1570 /DNA_ORIENTATION=-